MDEADVADLLLTLCAVADGLQLYWLIDRKFDLPGRCASVAEALISNFSRQQGLKRDTEPSPERPLRLASRDR